MRADDQRRLLAVVEASERRIDAEVNRAARRLVDQPRPLLVLRRRRREPEHPASAGEPPAQSIDRKRDGCRWKPRVGALSMRVRERPEQRLARPGRSRLGWKVLRVGEPRLERGHPCSGGKTRGRRDSHAARLRVAPPTSTRYDWFSLSACSCASVRGSTGGVRVLQRLAASKAHRRHKEGRRHRRETRPIAFHASAGNADPWRQTSTAPGRSASISSAVACSRASAGHRTQRQGVHLRKPWLVERDDLPRLGGLPDDCHARSK